MGHNPVPPDTWVEITGFGDPAPRYLLATDGREAAIEQAKAEYVYDRISLDELEERVAAALGSNTISPAAYLRHQLREAYGGAHEARRVMVLPKGMEIKHLRPDPGIGSDEWW